MHSNEFNEDTLEPQTREFYAGVLSKLQGYGIPFLAGGAYALGIYTGIVRDTKDFDIFVHPRDVKKLIELFNRDGYKAELTDDVWLAKLLFNGNLVDVIFGFRNGIAKVDDGWFAHARRGRLLGFDILTSPPEEILWSKCFIMTRERFDGADIAHMILAQGPSLDWARLLTRFGAHWRLLYVNLIMFGYIYPGQRDLIPAPLMQELTARLQQEGTMPVPPGVICNGPLLSATDFAPDVSGRGFVDPALQTGKI
jgi:hypothetical protein